MRHKGRVTEWRDERGFGFVTPLSGGERVFLHIKSLRSAQRRPAVGELVTYQLTRDPQGRLRAADVARTGDKQGRASLPGPGSVALWFAVLFLVLVTVAVLWGSLPVEILWGCLAANVLTFAMYAWDKSSARAGRWRTPESTLHLLAAAGGWPGALLAQRVLRHKTSKPSFQRVFWTTVLVNCGGVIWLVMK